MACGEQVLIPDGGVSSAEDDSVDVTVRVFPPKSIFPYYLVLHAVPNLAVL